MLEAFYNTVFRPGTPLPRPTDSAIVGMGLVLALLWALHLAASTGAGAWGVIGLTLLGLLVLAFSLLITGAFTHFFAQWQGGTGSARDTFGALEVAAWPLVLASPLAALAPWLGPLGGILSVALALWVMVDLVRAIAQAHAITKLKAALALAGTAFVGFFGLGLLVALPVLAIVTAFA